MKLRFWEVAQAVQAENDWQQWEDFTLTGVEFDSRIVNPGQLFVPLTGNNDGHQFAEQAHKNGAAAAFWSSSEKAPHGLPVLVVPDSLTAMQQLAVYYLQKIKPSVIGVTGSNGKTTTKDMVAAVLAQKFRTYKTQGNYNNDIGLPYTILHMPDDTEKIILEMGMDHAGEISFLSKLAQPDVAAITMIGEAHIEYFGSRQGIAAAKMEIVDGLKAGGLLLLPNQEPLLEKLSTHVKQKIETFGCEPMADYQGTVVELGKDYTRFNVRGFEQPLLIPVPGAYNVTNALIAVGIGRWFGLSEAEISAGLAGLVVTKNRTEWLQAANGAAVLSDVYNANPTAMKLVLDSFSQMTTTGKRVAVLGDMLELGAESQAMHQSVAAHLEPETIAEVFLYGEEMTALYALLTDRYGSQVHHYAKNQKSALIEAVQQVVLPQDMVVLKGSNGMGLAEVVAALTTNE